MQDLHCPLCLVWGKFLVDRIEIEHDKNNDISEIKLNAYCIECGEIYKIKIDR
jgi:hypothetical protein